MTDFETNKINLLAEFQDIGERLDLYLTKNFPDFSRSKIQKLIKNDYIKVNGESVRPSYQIKENDEIDVFQEEPIQIIPQKISLDVVFEDDNMLVINKPKNMLTHPTLYERENTLVNALLAYSENLSDLNGFLRPGIVHRLDRDTSGLLMVAKNNETHQFLAEQIKTKTAIRQYLAVCSGIVKEDFFKINKPIGHLQNKAKMGIVPIERGGKNSLTNVKVLKRLKNATYLELTLETGRTHQIRVHLSDCGHPILGDVLYGGGCKINLENQALHAYKLTFNLPFSTEQKTVEIEPSRDIIKLLKILGEKND